MKFQKLVKGSLENAFNCFASFEKNKWPSFGLKNILLFNFVILTLWRLKIPKRLICIFQEYHQRVK